MDQFILLNRTDKDTYHCWGPFPTEEEATSYQQRLGSNKGQFQVIPLTVIQTVPR